MTREEKEKAIDKLLVLMNDEIEKEGANIRTCSFNIAKDENIINYLGGLERTKEVIRASISRGYLKYLYLGHKDLYGIQLTEEGQARALSIILAKPNKVETSSNVSIGTLFNSGNMQVGDNNTQNIDNAVNTILNSIDKANAPEKQKEEAKNLFMKFIAHPLTQTLISAASGIGAAIVGK